MKVRVISEWVAPKNIPVVLNSVIRENDVFNHDRSLHHRSAPCPVIRALLDV